MHQFDGCGEVPCGDAGLRERKEVGGDECVVELLALEVELFERTDGGLIGGVGGRGFFQTVDGRVELGLVGRGVWLSPPSSEQGRKMATACGEDDAVHVVG